VTNRTPVYLFPMSAHPNWKIGGGKFSDVVRNNQSEEDVIFDRKYPELQPLSCFQGTVSPLFQQTDLYVYLTLLIHVFCIVCRLLVPYLPNNSPAQLPASLITELHPSSVRVGLAGSARAVQFHLSGM